MKTAAGQIRWIDLAAADAPKAADFYQHLFGWRAKADAAAGGAFTRLRLAGSDVGSLYQLSNAHLEQGVPSHWTPYVCVGDLDQAVRRAVASGGSPIVERFTMPGLADIALICDPVGALVGLWEDA